MLFTLAYLIVHMVVEIKECGVVFMHYMYPFKRYVMNDIAPRVELSKNTTLWR